MLLGRCWAGKTGLGYRGSRQSSSPQPCAVGTVDLSGDPDLLVAGVVGVRVFAGYAGWSPGQLEREIEGGSWFVFDALPSDAFAPRPDDLWHMVLRRQGGLMAAVAHYPADPTQN